MSEVRYAIRRLLKSPGFTLVAIFGLALGIGANVAFFSVVNSVFLRPLPYREPDRLVRLSSTNETQNLIRVGFSYSRFGAVQAQQQVFSDLALSIGNPFTLTGRGDPEQVIGLQASAGLLPALGLQPVLGRNFSADEDSPGGRHVVLISHAMWQSRFNGDRSVLGQALTLDGAPYDIIGVLPEAATAFPLNQLQIWVPRPAEVPFLVPSQLNGGGFFFQTIARLRPGVSLAQARDAMNVVAANYRAAFPANVDAPSQIEVVPLLDDAVGQQRQSYLLLFGAVACVLLIACANIANLVLARFAGRRREIAARFALGATRFDVMRQLVTESMLLAVLGGAVGVLLAQWALAALVAVGADFIPRAVEIRIDPLGARLRARRVARHRTGDRPAAGVAGGECERARSAEGSGTRIGRIGRPPAIRPARRRGVALARPADRGRLAAHELRAAAAGQAGIRTGRGPHRATGAAAGPLRSPEAHHLLRAVLSTPVGASGHHVGRPDRPGAADRRANAGAGGDQRPADPATERTRAGQPPPRLAALLHDARHPDSRRARFRRARQLPCAARRHRQRDVREAAFSRREPDRAHAGDRHGAAAVADRRRRCRRAQHQLERAAGAGLFPARTAAARSVHQHPGAHQPRPHRDAAGRARGAANRSIRICRCCSRSC